MEDFITTFTLILISCFIVNLIGSVYPPAKTKHTYMVVLSVIIVWICISPLNNLFTLFKEISEYDINEFSDSADNLYWEEGEESEFVRDVYESILKNQATTDD